MDKKFYLNFEGLSLYDELIKQYINSKNASLSGDLDTKIDNESARAKLAEQEILAALATMGEDLGNQITANANAIEVLNGDDETEGSVAKAVKDAVDGIVDGAPELLDTLKEVADWIANDEEGTSNLIAQVAQNKDDIAALQEADIAIKAELDAKIDELEASIIPIEEARISALFKEKVELADTTNVAEAIANLADNEMLVLPEGSVVTEDLVLDKDVFIDANGAVFTGTVTVAKGKEVVIGNATFVNPVKVI